MESESVIGVYKWSDCRCLNLVVGVAIQVVVATRIWSLQLFSKPRISHQNWSLELSLELRVGRQSWTSESDRQSWFLSVTTILVDDA